MAAATLGTPNKLKCFCRTKPLLAMYGRDSRGVLFIHIKVFKQDRLFGEQIIRGGVVEIRCRECLRWHRITIRESGPTLSEIEAPEELAFVAEADMTTNDSDSMVTT